MRAFTVLPGYVRLTSLLIALAFMTVQLQLPAGAQLRQSSRPRLVLLMVADQFSYDFLSRYQDKFGPYGLRLLLEQGADFTDCKYQDANTQTAPGHAVISTGSYPWMNGIIGNSWYDRRQGKIVEAVSDEGVELVGAAGSAGSTHNLIGTTLGDELKLASNGRSKVISVSLKDRASLFLAGRLANNAYWWDYSSGNFVTSTQYSHDLAPWAKAFNDTHYADGYFAKSWTRLLPENQYTESTRDDYPGERPLPGDSRIFPHQITGGASAPGQAFYSTFAATPWANDMVADFAKNAIEHENLGQHADPDYLGINFASGDLLGHSFGPNSQETEDLILRLDRTLSGLFQFIDQRVGLNNCLIVLTADHGVLPIPELLKERGLDAGRIDPRAFKSLLNATLVSRLGQQDWIEAFDPPNLYLNLKAINGQKYRQPEVEALTARVARSVPGVGDIFTSGQFFSNQLPSGPMVEVARRTYFGARSGELLVLTKPGYIFSSEPNGTTHGSPYAYDAQVPLLIFGTGIRAGHYGQSASPADIAPTIAAVLGIQVPSLCEGRVLYEAMGQVYGPPGARTLGTTQAP